MSGAVGVIVLLAGVGVVVFAADVFVDGLLGVALALGIAPFVLSVALVRLRDREPRDGDRRQREGIARRRGRHVPGRCHVPGLRGCRSRWPDRADQGRVGNTALAATIEAEELARFAVPARRGRPEIGLGNIAGTIVHFAALNAGIIAIVKPLTLGPQTTQFYLPVAVASPAIVAALLVVRKRLGRIEGAALTGLYVAYVAAAIAVST